MKILHTVSELRSFLGAYKAPALVPTMGNLHEGHLQLVRRAVAEKEAGRADVVVATIFVNRLQFLPHEDFDAYPRTLEADSQKLQSAGCDVVFAPSEKELYPQPQTYKVHPPTALADLLEGHFRPGFFIGVCTVVMKLFQLVQPRVAIFGKKDYQQFAVLRGMVEQFAMPITMIGLETERAADGLALSSRNGYLSSQERAQAIALNHALKNLIAQVQHGKEDVATLEAQAMQALDALGWKTDYLTIRRQQDLLPPEAGDTQLVALGAARLGKTRLIDNLEFIR